MTEQTNRSSTAFNMFSYLNFAVATVMMTGGIYFLEASFSAKGFYAMAALMLVSSTVGVTKAMRDKEDSERLQSKLGEARTERLIAEAAGTERRAV